MFAKSISTSVMSEDAGDGRVTKITGRAPLSGLFTNSRFIDEALKVLEGESNSNEIIRKPH